MKPNQLATLTLRLMGIYCLIQSVPILGMFGTVIVYAQHSDGGSTTSALVASLLPGVCMLVIGVLLICFATPWGEKLTPPVTTDASVSPISFEQVQLLAFALTGLLIFADALPQLFNSISDLMSWVTAGKDDWQRQGTYRAYSFREGTAAIGTVLKAVLGFILFFRARGFANFWRSLRQFGTPKPPQA
ncbi:MAG TPA: hypothetical protein VF437_03525 [Verrucomicrobiae bacterium]|jgi:hypothetical protein